MPNKTLSSKRISNKILLVISILIFLSIKTLAGNVPPVTTVTLNPEQPDGKNEWYVSPVEITLEATDTESGVREIYYIIDGGIPQKKNFANSLNLAPNPSFEESEANPPLNTIDWKISSSDPGTGYTRDILTYMPDFPTTSIKIDAIESRWHSINHSESFSFPSSYNKMSAYAWIKTTEVSGSAFFNIYSISQDTLNQITYNFEGSSGVITGTNDWTRISANFTVSHENVIGVYMEIGFSGTGTMWVDAVNISNSPDPVFSFYVANDGEHTVQYYSIDNAKNTEETKSVSFKIDQTPPGNWKDSGAVRVLSGAEHEVYVWTNVEDATSGMSPFTDRFQYTTSKNTGFGYFTDLLACNSTWMANQWFDLISPPFLPGSKTAYLLTPKIDFCDSNWQICKFTRFYAEDMAGNFIMKDMCINGPWIRVRGKGVVRANHNIDMISEAYEPNTDGLIEVGGDSITFFDTSADLYGNYMTKPPDYSYEHFFNVVRETKEQISTTGNLTSVTGVYYINGDYTLTKQKTPNNFNTATFNQIIFIEGNLTISDDITVSNASTALFIVKGNINIDKSVTNLSLGLFSDGIMSTAYNIKEGEQCKTLNLKGIFTAEKIVFQRTLQGTQNEKDPSEDILYEPKYIIKMAEYIGTNSVKWVYSD